MVNRYITRILTTLCVSLGAAHIPLSQAAAAEQTEVFDGITLIDTQGISGVDPNSAILTSSSTGAVRVFISAALVDLPLPEGVAAYELVDVFPVTPRLLIRVGVDLNSDSPVVELVSLDGLTSPGGSPAVKAVESTLEEWGRAPAPVDAYLAGLQLYLVGRHSTEVTIFDLCRLGLRDLSGVGVCNSPHSSPRHDFIQLDTPPLTDFVVTDRPYFFISVHGAQGMLMISDLRSGKVIDIMTWRYLDLWDSSIDIGSVRSGTRAGNRTSLIVNIPSQGIVQFMVVDLDFGQFRLQGEVNINDLSGAPAYSTLGFPPMGDEGRPIDLVGRSAVSDDLSIILLGGRDNALHVLSAGSAGGTVIQRLFDIRSGDHSLLDFDVSDDGSRIALLYPRGPLFLETDRLMTSDLNQREAYLRELGVASPEVSGDRSRDFELTQAVQVRLAAEGFYRGISDGVFGPATLAALERFTQRNALDLDIPSDLKDSDTELLVALFKNDPDSLPENVLSADAESYIKQQAFYSTYASDVRHFSAEEVFILGLNDTCLGVNALPPEEHWPEILRALRALDEIREASGQPIRITSTAQTTDYAECNETPAPYREFMRSFRGIEFVPRDAGAGFIEILDEIGFDGGLLYGRDPNDERRFYIAAPKLPRELPTEPGEWVVQIASYSPSTKGCQAAIEDVGELARLLAGSGVKGNRIYVARTGESPDTVPPTRNFFVVLLDLGTNEKLARMAIQEVRAVSSETSDGVTGREAFARTTEEFHFDHGCLTGQRIRSQPDQK